MIHSSAWGGSLVLHHRKAETSFLNFHTLCLVFLRHLPNSLLCGHAHILFATTPRRPRAGRHWLLISSDDLMTSPVGWHMTSAIGSARVMSRNWGSQLATTVYGCTFIWTSTYIQTYFFAVIFYKSSDPLIFALGIKCSMKITSRVLMDVMMVKQAVSIPHLKQQQVSRGSFPLWMYIWWSLFLPKCIRWKRFSHGQVISMGDGTGKKDKKTKQKNKRPPSRRQWENHGKPNLIRMDHMWNRDKISWWEGPTLGPIPAVQRWHLDSQWQSTVENNNNLCLCCTFQKAVTKCFCSRFVHLETLDGKLRKNVTEQRGWTHNTVRHANNNNINQAPPTHTHTVCPWTCRCGKTLTPTVNQLASSSQLPQVASSEASATQGRARGPRARIALCQTSCTTLTRIEEKRWQNSAVSGCRWLAAETTSNHNVCRVIQCLIKGWRWFIFEMAIPLWTLCYSSPAEKTAGNS